MSDKIDVLDRLNEMSVYLLNKSYSDLLARDFYDTVGYAIDLIKKQQNEIATMKMVYGTDVKLVGELVRCKDCKHWKRRECGSYGTCESENMNICGFFDADWFCADGERKDK